MKKNILALAFTLMLASTTVLADGETGHGNRAPVNPPAATAYTDGETGHGNRNSDNSSAVVSQSDSSDTILDKIFGIIYAIVA